MIVGLSPSVTGPQARAQIRLRVRQGWIIFGMKEGLNYLKRDLGVGVHYAAMMDPGETEVARTPLYDDVTYCIASSCNPKLFDHLAGCRREIFHSACGWPDEVKLYQQLFGNGDTIVGGFTVANRALGLAAYFGIKNLEMVGVDFGRRESSGPKHYAGFVEHPPLNDVWMSDDGKVDGRPWLTRPDLLASAVTIAWMIKRGEVSVIGDSLANALARREDEFLQSIISIGKKEQPLEGPLFHGVVPIWPQLKLAA